MNFALSWIDVGTHIKVIPGKEGLYSVIKTIHFKLYDIYSRLSELEAYNNVHYHRKQTGFLTPLPYLTGNFPLL